MPGAYFSPLTSPALTAQSQQHAHQHAQITTSGSSTGHSPIDVDMEMLGEPAMLQQEQPGGRKLRSTNKRNAPRSANPNSRVRQSPIVKPGRRKATVSTSIAPKEVSQLVQEARGGRTPNGLDVPQSRNGSETDSISPEPMLSEMRPPPKPGSLTQSPAMMALNGQGSTPATPASLMRIHPSPNFSDTMDAPLMMEDLTLPEPSLERPALDRLDTLVQSAEGTPRMAARKTPKMGPLSTPGAAFSGKPSPMIEPATTPTSPAFSMTNGKPRDPKVARNAKKRNSTCSTLMSPALMPKISPSIKPLLPDGGNRESLLVQDGEYD
jgi:hypothetical protein